jgi:thiosulfate/3-mercaptopyruvate sulfurtransferase
MILTALAGTDVLSQHLDDPDWLVFDCRHDLADPARGRAEYARSHIPGARFLHLDEDLSAPKTGKNGRHPLPDADKLAAKLGDAGVDARKQVVAYDAQGGMVASRLWWLLRWLGHLPVAVLDGGWEQWLAEGGPVTAEVPRPQAKRFEGRARNDCWVGAHFVRDHLGDETTVLIDGRAPDRFRGQNETIDPVGGRIPFARNRFYRDNLDTSGRFKAPEALKAEFKAILGRSGPQQAVNYCGSGVSACHNILAMEVAGLRGARLYPGSWSEWIADASRPVASGEQRPGGR